MSKIITPYINCLWDTRFFFSIKKMWMKIKGWILLNGDGGYILYTLDIHSIYTDRPLRLLHEPSPSLELLLHFFSRKRVYSSQFFKQQNLTPSSSSYNLSPPVYFGGSSNGVCSVPFEFPAPLKFSGHGHWYLVHLLICKPSKFKFRNKGLFLYICIVSS